MESLLMDLRFGIRLMLKRPGFTLIAVLSLALGVGANTAMFSLLNAIILRPLPVPEPERLVDVYPGAESVSFVDYQTYHDHATVFSDVAAHNLIPLNVTLDGQPERVYGEIVTGNYFRVLGIRPTLGRDFLPEEDEVPSRNAVAVIGYGLWQRRFAADPNILSRTITINNQQFSIVGVAPASFSGTMLGALPELWVPMMMQERVWPGTNRLGNPDSRGLGLTARLAPGVTSRQATAAVDTIRQQIAASRPSNLPTWDFVQVETAGGVYRKLRTPVYVLVTLLFAVVGFVLLIACANVANLLLARATARRKEIAIRLALGAGRTRIIAQLLTESLLLSIVGSLAGLVVAYWSLRALVAYRPALSMPIDVDLGLDTRVLLFTLALSLVTGVAFGITPALQASRPDVVPALKDETVAVVRGHRRFNLKNALVVVQVALCFVLLIGAGLLVRSLQKAQSIQPGFEVDRQLVAPFELGSAGYTEPKAREFYRQLEERVGHLPGVQSVSVAQFTPLGFGRESLAVIPEGSDLPDGSADFMSVDTRYFDTMGIPIVAGRDVSAQDVAGGPRIAVVNEALAAKYFGGDSAVGRRVRLLDFDGPTEPYEIVGVVKNSKFRTLGEDARPFLYIPFAQAFKSDMTLHVRTAGDPRQLLGAVRDTVKEMDSTLPVDVKPFADTLGAAFFLPRVGAVMLGALGVLGLVLAALGIYGVLAYYVSQQGHDIRVRMALGAQRSDIYRLIIGRGIALTGVGLGVGLVLAIGLAQVIRGYIYGGSPMDPLIYASISALLLGVAFLACYIPARRASKADPVEALRAS